MFKNGNGGTSLPVVAPVGVMFKLNGNAYQVVGQIGASALVENQITHRVLRMPLQRFSGNAGWMWAELHKGNNQQ